MRLVVLDIGGTSIKSAVYEDGFLNGYEECETEAAKGGEYVLTKVLGLIRSRGRCDGIGISTAGQVDVCTGTIIHANDNIPGYTGIELGRLTENEFGVPVAVENDVNAAAVGEGHFGAARDETDFLCLTYGTGVGGAVVIDRKVYRGYSGSAGEFGSIITHGNKAKAGKRAGGCYETYASTEALVRRINQIIPGLDNGKKIFSSLELPEVKKNVDEWISEIAYGLVTLIHIFNPKCVILGGGVMNQSYVVEEVKRHTGRYIMPSFAGVRICSAALGNKAGLWGVAYLAEEKIKNNP